jgi:type IV secretory pathway VirJ component
MAGEFPKPDAQGTVEVAVAKPARTLIIFLSGDGGWWGDIDALIAGRFADIGYAVVGVDTNVWFNSERSAKGVAAHLGELAQHYGARVHAVRYVLAGYSFGADVLPIALGQLASGVKSRVRAVLLIAPERRTPLQVSLLEQTGVDSGNIDLAPFFAALPKSKTICVYGKDDEDSSGCTQPELKGADIIALPGSHHFNNDVKSLFAETSKAVLARTPP